MNYSNSRYYYVNFYNSRYYYVNYYKSRYYYVKYPKSCYDNLNSSNSCYAIICATPTVMTIILYFRVHTQLEVSAKSNVWTMFSVVPLHTATTSQHFCAIIFNILSLINISNVDSP